ncbi:MAG: YdcF family protein [Nevskia sp.]|nr:YdcF family protein [Nevskia sp.]
MSFVVSKILWAMLAPGTLLALLLLGALLWHRRRPGLSRGLLLAAILLVGTLGLMPLSHWVAAPLERRFPVTELPAHVDGIIVLGGAISPEDSPGPQRPALNLAGERITGFVALARRYPDAKLVYSGGTGLLRHRQVREADLVRPLLESLGVDSSRVIFERESRNTWENALYSKKLADPRAGQTWLLVTSAWHMPRSVGCFRMAGWDVVPYPVNFIGDNQDWAAFETGVQLTRVGLAEKEWIGLLLYHVLGRTDAWFPAPRGGAP